MPIYLRKHPDMKEIFNACTGGINDRMICQKHPLRVKKNAAFINNQKLAVFATHSTFRLTILQAPSNVAKR